MDQTIKIVSIPLKFLFPRKLICMQLIVSRSWHESWMFDYVSMRTIDEGTIILNLSFSDLAYSNYSNAIWFWCLHKLRKKHEIIEVSIKFISCCI